MTQPTSNDFGSGELAISIPGHILVLVTLQLHLIPLSVWRLEVDGQFRTLDSVDGPQDPGLMEMEVQAFTPLSSEGLQGLLRVHSQGETTAVNQILQRSGCV